MHRRRFLKTAALAAGATTSALVSTAGAQTGRPEFRWRMATSWPRNAPGVGVNAQRLADLIGVLSGGRMQVDLFSAGELVPPFEVLDAVSGGAVEMGHTALYYGIGKAPALHFFTTIPYGMNMAELAAWYEFGGGQMLKDEVLAPLNMRAFLAGNSGVQAMGWFRREIRSLEDLKGLKMRIAGLGGDVMRLLGVNTVLIPPGEIFQAMSAGAVDAAEWVGPWNDLAFGLHRVAQYYYLPAFHEPGPSLEALVNLDAFGTLPADLQAIVQSAAQAVALTAQSDFLFHNIQALEVLAREHGIVPRTMPEDVNDALAGASREVIAALMDGDADARRVGESYLGFLRQAIPYNGITEYTLQAQRARVWA